MGDTSLENTYVKFPAHQQMEMLNKCWVIIRLLINDKGNLDLSLLLEASSQYGSHIKPMRRIMRGLNGEVRKSMNLLCTSSRGARDCRFLVVLLLLKKKRDNGNDSIDKFKLSNKFMMLLAIKWKDMGNSPNLLYFQVIFSLLGNERTPAKSWNLCYVINLENISGSIETSIINILWHLYERSVFGFLKLLLNYF